MPQFKTMHDRTKTILLAVTIITLTRALLAQDSGPKGLDALSDERLRNDLAARNLTGLLDRAFEVDKTPPDEQEALRGRMGLLRLSTENITNLVEVRKLVSAYVAQLPKLLPKMNDPQALINDANLLIDNGITTDDNLLEYFGPNGNTMARLNPVAVAVQQLLARAQEKADAIATDAANDWPAKKPQWVRADQQKTIAEYTKNIISYPLALSIDKADPQRATILQSSLDYLSQYDTDDNPDRAAVRFYIGQMHLAQGTPDSLNAALGDFDFATKNGNPKDIRQQFEARFLTASAEIELGNPAAATDALTALQDWAKGNGVDPGQLAIATGALQYRIAEASGKPDDADAILDNLQQQRPELRGLILELMASRIDPNKPISQYDDLLLQAVLAAAETQTIKPDGQPFDSNAVTRGVEAAQEIIKRPATTPEAKTLRDNCQYVLGFFLQKLGRRPEAAQAFLDFIDQNKSAGKSERLDMALNNAIALVHDAYVANSGDADVTKAYDRVLATAVAAPFNRVDFAYEFGRRLQANGKFDAAIDAFRLVPPSDPNYAESQYYLMVAVRQQLDREKPGDAVFQSTLHELNGLIDSVNTALTKALVTEKNPQRATVDRMRLAQTRLLGGDVALHDEKNPQRALDLLNSFESDANDLPNKDDILGEVLLIRVQAYVQLDKIDQATDQLVKLAQQNPNGAGQIVYDLLKKLDEQVTTAEAHDQTDQVAQLERNRAMLTPFLVRWASNHPNPNIKRLTYTYSVFDADTQRRAAELTKDPTKRKQLLEAALQRFETLDSAEGLAQYRDTLPEDKRAKALYDPQVKLGLGRVYFAMQDWTNARLQFALLFRDKVLGTGFITAPNAAGTFETKENPSYWESMYKLIRCNLALNENVEGMKGLLEEQQLIYGDQLGGQRWKKEFAGLLDEMKIAPVATQPA